MEVSDKDLVSRYLKGEVDALEALVIKYKSILYGYIVNMTGSTADADEVFQEVWFRVIKKIKSYKHGNFGGWLIRIAHNYVIDRARKRKPDVSLDQETHEGGSIGDILPDKEPGPDTKLERRELKQKIKAAVDMLPLDQKEVFTLRTEAGMSFKEIARAQGVSINTALARMQYAIEKLRPLLGKAYQEN